MFTIVGKWKVREPFPLHYLPIAWKRDRPMLFSRVLMKCNQPCLRFELGYKSPFPMTIIIMLFEPFFFFNVNLI